MWIVGLEGRGDNRCNGLDRPLCQVGNCGLVNAELHITALKLAFPLLTDGGSARSTGTHEIQRMSHPTGKYSFWQWGILATKRAHTFRGLQLILAKQ